MTDKSAAAIREILKKYDEKPYSDISGCLSDLTALISEHYTANEEVKKMVEERLREELMAYDKYIGAKGWIDNYEDETAEPTVDEYLKSR